MSTETTTTTTGEGAPIANESESLLRRVLALRDERDRIDQEVATILATLRGDPSDPRPEWGPCTRCAHVWRGKFLAQPPRCCPQCGSSGWNRPPLNRNARHPTDPPNPNWARRQEVKNRRTGRKPGRPRTRLRPGETSLPSTAIAPPPQLESLATVAPPQRLEVVERMVPSESVRFAQVADPPQPERTVSQVHISEVATLTKEEIEELAANPRFIADIVSIPPMPVVADDQLAEVEAIVEEANKIPIGVNFRGDHSRVEPDTTDPTVDYVRVGNAWVPASQALDGPFPIGESERQKSEMAKLLEEQLSYEEAERGRSNEDK